MPSLDFRDFLGQLEQQGQLVRLSDEILPEPDVRAVARAAADMVDTGPAVLMDNIKGYKGKKLAVNVHGSWANYAIMMGMPKTTSLKEMFYELARRWESSAGEVKWVTNPVCQQNVITGNINLYEILPLYRVNPYDGGFYFSKASVITRDPEYPGNFDKTNVGLYRMQVHGPDTIGLNIQPAHDIGTHLRKAEENNQPLPIAICLGVHPMLSVLACTPLAYGQSEFKFAAALDGRTQELAKALTCDLDLPAGTEIVLEGEVVPRQRSAEGPFGEMPGCYSALRSQYRIKVKAVTHRNDPIMESLYVGMPWTEHDTLVGLSTCVPLYQQLRETMPEVKAVNALYQHGLTVIVAVDNKFGHYAKTVAMRLASTPHGVSYCKNIILVDGFVDPFDLVQVMWALSTRVRPAKDVIVVHPTRGHPSDPSSEPPGISGKVIIDATTPAYPDKTGPEYRLIDKVESSELFRRKLQELQRLASGRKLEPTTV